MIENINTNEIMVEGLVEIINGDTIIKTKNKFVQTTLQTILNFLSSVSVGSTNCTDCITGPADPNVSGGYRMCLGTDQTTPTFFNTTALSSPIGPAPGTTSNSIGVSQTNPSDGIFRITITALWNAGTVNGTVGEMALYMNLFAAGNLRPFGWSGIYVVSNSTLASRLSVADLAFSPFIIDATNPLTIIWTIQLSFV